MTLCINRFIPLLALALVLGIGVTHAALDSQILTPVFNQTDNTWGVNLEFKENDREAFAQTYTVNLCTNGYACPASHNALKVVIKMPALSATRIFINDTNLASYLRRPGDESRVPISFSDELPFGLVAQITSIRPSPDNVDLQLATLELSLSHAPYFGSRVEVNPTGDGFIPCRDRLSVGINAVRLNLAFNILDAEVLPVSVTSINVGCGKDSVGTALLFNLDEPDDNLLNDNGYDLMVFDTEGHPLAHFPLLRLQPRNNSAPLITSIAERPNYLPDPEGLEIKVLSVNVSDNNQVNVVSSLNVSNITLGYTVVRLNYSPCDSTLNDTLIAGNATAFTASFIDCQTPPALSTGVIVSAAIIPLLVVGGVGVGAALLGSLAYYRHNRH